MRIWDVALKTCQRRWTIGRSDERGLGISVLAAGHDDDDDDFMKVLGASEIPSHFNRHQCRAKGTHESDNGSTIPLIPYHFFFLIWRLEPARTVCFLLKVTSYLFLFICLFIFIYSFFDLWICNCYREHYRLISCYARIMLFQIENRYCYRFYPEKNIILTTKSSLCRDLRFTSLWKKF